MISGFTVDVPERKWRLQRLEESLHAENVKGVLERQLSRKKSYLIVETVSFNIWVTG